MALTLSNKANTAKISTFGLGSSRKPDPKIHGGKGAGLIEMSNQGLGVPPGFVIQVSNYHDWLKAPHQTMDRLRVQIKKTLVRLEKAHAHNGPMLYSVRSGAEVSMPGMMDTILNVGATPQWVGDAVVQASDEDTNRWLLDCRRRFLQMFGAVVKQVPAHNFEKVLTIARADAGVEHDSELDADQLLWVVSQFEGMVLSPDDPLDQIMECVGAVFRSWMNPRAVEYRKQNNISEDMGTAVIIQLMVFGNLGTIGCGSGVIFSRNPSDGYCMPVVEYLENAQGEDVVAGVRTPLTTSEFATKEPILYHQIVEVSEQLENFYSDMVDIEFTVVCAKLYILQVRVGKRTGAAAFRIARDLLDEGQIDLDEVRKRLQVSDYTYATRPRLVGVTIKPALTGLPASPGVAQGIPVSGIDHAVIMIKTGQPFIWVAHETNPDHIAIMNKSQGVLTEVGGITSHAAVVARGMNKPCVTACPGALKLVGSNDTITMDGSNGKVWKAKFPVTDAGWSEDVTCIMTELFKHMKARFKGPDLVMDGQVLQCGHWFHNPTKGQGSKALAAIQEGEVTDVVLDIRVMSGPSTDDILSTAMGESSAMVREVHRQAALFEYLLNHDLQSVITLTGGSDPVLEPLVEAGYKSVYRVSVKSPNSIGLLAAAVQAGSEVSLEGLDEDLTESKLKELIPGLKTTLPTMTITEMLGG